MRRDPRETDQTLRERASEHAGYFTASEALSVGYSYRQQHFHRKRGNWLTIHRGVFRFRDYPASDHEDLIRWALWSRNRKGKIQAVVSYDTALSVYEISDLMPARVHLTVPLAFRKKPPGACVLHRARLAHDEVTKRAGFLITTPLRTIADLAEGALSIEHLSQALRQALDQGLLRRSSLEQAHVSAKARQRLEQALSGLDAS